jgi:(p)ppGpp synthase/HD superfamily hydrolase
MQATESLLSQRFESALVYAFRLHACQLRKDGKTPYISHLLSVTALVLENNGDEDEAIAALLHDAVEDQGGQPTAQYIRQQFGDRVIAIVEGCSEPTRTVQTWKQRKQAYLDHLQQANFTTCDRSSFLSSKTVRLFGNDSIVPKLTKFGFINHSVLSIKSVVRAL